MDEIILKAYRIIIHYDEQPDLEAIWGYHITLTDGEKIFSKQQVKEVLEKYKCIHYFKGELRHNPIKEVW